MKDIIYREDVTELIKKSRNSTDWDEADAGAFFHWTAKLNRDIDKLPSAERTGKWVNREDVIRYFIGLQALDKITNENYDGKITFEEVISKLGVIPSAERTEGEENDT